jgi:hypothetical protein
VSAHFLLPSTLAAGEYFVAVSNGAATGFLDCFVSDLPPLQQVKTIVVRPASVAVFPTTRFAIADHGCTGGVNLQIKTDEEISTEKGGLDATVPPTYAAGYALYSPQIERFTVLDPLRSPFQYNHDASIALFKGVWIAVWNANTNLAEGKPGQFNAMSQSSDQLVTWSSPVRAFSDAAYATNPVPCDADSCAQWQPNLFPMADGRLGCVWSGGNGRDGKPNGEAMVTYFSVLSTPYGKWTNQAIVFEPQNRTQPFFAGSNWSLFASQNPAVLPSGRILAPVVMTGVAALDAPAGCTSHPVPHNVSQMCRERRSSVLISDDNGDNWRASEGTTIPGKSWAQWEPTVWAPDSSSGDVLMISRYNDFRLPSAGGPVADKRMQHAKSTDSGTNWTPLQPLPLDTVVSRMEVSPQRGGISGNISRFMMVMNDVNPFNVAGTHGRLNVALFLSPVGTPEVASLGFAPGVGLSDFQEIAMYPQMWQYQDRLAVIWSSGDQPRGIRVVSLPLPAPGKRVVALRNNSYFETGQAGRPTIRGSWLQFFGDQRLESASPMSLPESSPPGQARSFSAGGWIRLKPTLGRSGTLLDSRGLPTGGFILGVKAISRGGGPTAALGEYSYAPYSWLWANCSQGNTTNVELAADSPLANFFTTSVHAGLDTYMGWSVNASGRACFFCAANGTIEEETVAFNEIPDSWPLSSAFSNVTVGFRNSVHSSITGFNGELGSLAVFGGRMLSSREHAALANYQGKFLDISPSKIIQDVSGWVPTHAEAGLWLNASDALVAAKFPLPDAESSDKPRVDRSNGQSLLRLCQHTSASLELPPVSCLADGPGVRITLRFRLQASVANINSHNRSFVVATIGDGDAHTRLLAKRSNSGSTGFELRLMCSSDAASSVVVAPALSLDAWTTVLVSAGPGGIMTANTSAALHCGCTSGGPVWAFLGEGFLHRNYTYSDDCVEHDLRTLDSAQLWVTRRTVHASSRDTKIVIPDAPAAAAGTDAYDVANTSSGLFLRDNDHELSALRVKVDDVAAAVAYEKQLADLHLKIAGLETMMEPVLELLKTASAASPGAVHPASSQTLGMSSVHAFGAVGNGLVDDAAAIQRAIDNVSVAGGVVYIAPGMYLCKTSLRLRPRVSVVGSGWGVSIIDSRALGTAIYADQLLEHIRLEEFTVSHAHWDDDITRSSCSPDGSGEGVGCTHLVELRASAARSRISLQLIGRANVTASALVVRGLNPVTGRPNNACYGLSIKLSTSAPGSVVDGVALWLDGRDVENARCNAHYIEPTSVLDGFTTGVKLNGNGNTLSGVTFNGPTSNASVYLYGDGTFGNTALGCYFDGGITGKVIKLDAVSNNHMLTVYESVNTITGEKIQLVGASTARFTIQSRGLLELGGGNGAGLIHNGLNSSSPRSLDKSSAEAAVVGVGSKDTLGLIGVPTTLGSGLIVAGENFTAGINAVSDGGGASIQIADTATAEFRVVKSTTSGQFEPVFGVDSLGRLHLASSAAGSNREAAASLAPAPAGFIDVMVGDVLRKIAYYEADAPSIKTDDAGRSYDAARASATISASYPFLNGERYLFHARQDHRNALLVGKGGGFVVLDADSETLDPLAGLPISVALETATTGGQLHGFAPDVLSADDEALFAAAGHAGLFRLEAATYTIAATKVVGDAWAVTRCQDVVVVGTHGSVAEGGPQLLGLDATTLEQLWTLPAAGDIWAVTCSASKGKSTLVVGGWCIGMQAYTVSRTGADLSARWDGDSPLFVRDAILSSSGDSLVVSANLAGVQAFKLSANKFDHLWTISLGGTATGLSLPPGSADVNAVVAAWAPAYGAQFQFFGTCGAPVPCDAPPPEEMMYNSTAMLASSTAMLIDAAFSSQPHVRKNMTAEDGLCLFSNESKHSGALRQAGVFTRDGEVFMAAMCPQLMVLPFRDHTAVSKRHTSGVFGNAFDSVNIEGKYLYTSSEQGLATFSLPELSLLSAPTLAGAGVASAQGCIAMGSTVDRIFCSAHSVGISVYSLAQPTVPAFLGHVTSNSPTQRAYASPVPVEALDDPQHLWLYATMGRNTFSIFNVTEKDPALAVQLATLDLPVTFVFGVAVATVDGSHYVYVSYSNGTSRRGGASTSLTEVGVLTLEARLSIDLSTCTAAAASACGGAKKVSAGNCLVCCSLRQARLKKVGCTDADLDAFCQGTTPPAGPAGLQLRLLGTTVGRTAQPASVLAGGATLDAERSRLYVAYSCSSVIAYDISTPNEPWVWAVRDLTDHMVFQVSLGPGSFVYIGLPAAEDHDRTPNITADNTQRLGTGIAMVDVSTAKSFAHGPVSVLPVAWSAIAQTTVPGDKSQLIVADGSSGLFALQVVSTSNTVAMKTDDAGGVLQVDWRRLPEPALKSDGARLRLSAEPAGGTCQLDALSKSGFDGSSMATHTVPPRVDHSATGGCVLVVRW